MDYLGDVAPGAIVRSMWNSSDANGASITRSTNGTISVYKDGGTTQSTAGVTDTEDFDSLTGVHLVAIDTSADGTFYSAGSDFIVVLSGATIDTRTVNAALFSFSLNNRSLQSRLPAALVSGRIDASVGAMAADTLTATAIASGAITAAKFAVGAVDASAIADEAIDAATFAAGAITSGAFATGAITAAVIGPNAIGASELAADAVTEIQSGLATAANLATVAEYVDTEVAAIKAKTDLIPGTIDGKTFSELVTLFAAVLLGKASGLATTTAVYRAVDDSKDRVTAGVDSDGNRSAITLDAS